MSEDCIEIASKSARCVEILDLFNEQRKTNELCDVIIITKDGTLNAHRLVLAAGSPFFRTMFSSPMKETNTGEINFPDIDYDTMDRIVHFIYTTQLRISAETAQNVLIAANFLQIENLVDSCANYMMKYIDETNCFFVKNLFKTTNCDKKYVARVDNYINSYFLRISQNESFVELGIDEVTELLSSEICCKSEEDVFHAAVRWLEARDEPDKYSEQILRCIRLSLLSESFKQFHISNNSLFKANKRINVNKVSRTPKTSMLGLRRLNDESSLYTYDSSSKEWTQMMELENKNYTNIAASKDYIFVCSEDIESKTRFLEAYNRETKEWIKLLPNMHHRGSVDMVTVGNKLYVFRHNVGRDEVTQVTVFNMDDKNQRGKKLKSENSDLSRRPIIVFEKNIYALKTLSKYHKLNTETNTWSVTDSDVCWTAGAPHTTYKGKIYGRLWHQEELFGFYNESENKWEKSATMPKDIEKYVSTTDGIYGFQTPYKRREETKPKDILKFFDFAQNVWICEGELPDGYDDLMVTAIPD